LDVVHLAHIKKPQYWEGLLVDGMEKRGKAWWDHYQLDCTPLHVPPEGEGKSTHQMV